MLPMLRPISRQRTVTAAFRGLNLSEGITDGEFAWMENMDTREAPAVTRRRKRLHVGTLRKPNGLCATDRVCFVDGTKFYYNGLYYGDVTDSFKTLVPMGARICIFPDKRIFDTQTYSFSSMEQRNRVTGSVEVTLAKADGTAFAGYATGATPPEKPADGALWLDTGAVAMKQFSEAQGSWVTLTTVCVKISAAGIGHGLQAQDAVEVQGLTQKGLNGSWVLLGAEENAILYTGITDSVGAQTGTVTVERTCPDMDFVVERDNRLWGCSSSNHEIYCCRLGDPTNWRAYEGLSTDAYAVTVGTPGPFTGAAVSGSAVIFAKESCIHKVYGTQPSNFQVMVDQVRGVQQGCAGSMVRVNECLYYKSVFDFCVYADSEVRGISGALGTANYKEAISGVCGGRLYVSCRDAQGAWQLLCCDTETGLWMREDSTHAVAFASCLTETFMLTAEGKLYALLPGEYSKDLYMVGSDYIVEAAEETDREVGWELRTGQIARQLPDRKYIGKIQVVLALGAGAAATLSVRRDGGTWEQVATLAAQGQQRYTLPIYPRRCGFLEIRLTGTGDMKMLSMSKTIAEGSEYGC